jgi:hypothetical protein
MLELLGVTYRGWLRSEGILYRRKFNSDRSRAESRDTTTILHSQLHPQSLAAFLIDQDALKTFLSFLGINGRIIPNATMGCIPCCLRSRKPLPTTAISLPLHDKPSQFSSCSRVIFSESFIPQRNAPPSPTLEFHPLPPPNDSTDPPLVLHIPKPLSLEIEPKRLSSNDYERIAQLEGDLIHLLKAHSTLITLTKSQTLSDIDSILQSISSPSPSHNALSSLRRSISSLYAEKETIQSHYFHPLTSTLLSKWSSFSALEPAQQIKQARVLRENCLLMQIFTLLKGIRIGCEGLRNLDGKLRGCVRGGFEDILAGLKGEGDGRGASMRWRVFELVETQRRGVVGEGIEGILRGRVGLSACLLGAVEELKEG